MQISEVFVTGRVHNPFLMFLCIHVSKTWRDITSVSLRLIGKQFSFQSPACMKAFKIGCYYAHTMEFPIFIISEKTNKLT